MITVGGGAQLELRLVLLREALDEVDLLEGELHGVAVLRVARHVRRPELTHTHTHVSGTHKQTD